MGDGSHLSKGTPDELKARWHRREADVFQVRPCTQTTHGCGVCNARCLPILGRGDWLEAVAGARGVAHRFFLSDFGRCSGWHWLHSVHLPPLVRSRRYQWFPLVTSQNVSYACEYFVLDER